MDSIIKHELLMTSKRIRKSNIRVNHEREPIKKSLHDIFRYDIIIKARPDDIWFGPILPWCSFHRDIAYISRQVRTVWFFHHYIYKLIVTALRVPHTRSFRNLVTVTSFWFCHEHLLVMFWRWSAKASKREDSYNVFNQRRRPRIFGQWSKV